MLLYANVSINSDTKAKRSIAYKTIKFYINLKKNLMDNIQLTFIFLIIPFVVKYNLMGFLV